MLCNCSFIKNLNFVMLELLSFDQVSLLFLIMIIGLFFRRFFSFLLCVINYIIRWYNNVRVIKMISIGIIGILL